MLADDGSIIMPFCRSAIDLSGGEVVFFPCISWIGTQTRMTGFIFYAFSTVCLTAAAPYTVPIIDLYIKKLFHVLYYFIYISLVMYVSIYVITMLICD